MNNNDITALLYRIKENIKAIENGDLREPILDEVRSDFLDLLELIKLFLISERDSYYGYFLMNMQFRVSFQSNCIAGIKLNEFPPVFESNPLLLCKFTLKEIIYVVCHEIDHVVLNHPAEMVKANPEGDPDRRVERIMKVARPDQLIQRFVITTDVIPASLIIGIRTLLTTNPGASATSTGVFFRLSVSGLEGYLPWRTMRTTSN